MTGKELYEISREWDLTSHAGCLVFSDWLLERGEIRWCNYIRWVSLIRSPDFSTYYNIRAISDWIKCASSIPDSYPVDDAIDHGYGGGWLEYAEDQKWDVVPLP